MPLLDLQAEHDPFKPPEKRNEMKDEFGDRVTIAVIPDASHALIPEQPKAVVDALVTWIRTLPSALWESACSPPLIAASRAPLEHGRALLHHGAGRLARVLGVHQLGAVFLLQRIAFVDRHELDAVERFLAHAQAERRLVGDHAGKLVDLRHQPVERYHPIDEADAMGLLRADRHASEEHPPQQALRDVTRHMRGAAAAADIDLGQAEGGVLRRDADVADRGEHAAGAERRAVHRRDHRNRAVAHRMEHAPHDHRARRIVLDLGGEKLAQIEAGAECLRAARATAPRS